jgi:putative RNA 2'-phosphotransferase
MDRQYVHLSPDRETAILVGSRHAARPIVITIRAAEAHGAGIGFYHPTEAVYLAEMIPPTFLEVES